MQNGTPLNLVYIRFKQYKQTKNISQCIKEVNCPYFPKLAFKKKGKIIHEKITSSCVN